MSKKKDTNPGDSFVMHRRGMYESDAYKSLGKVEMKILARIEIELMSHRGSNNGRIICTYDDFEKYGVRRMSINPGLRNLSKVGLLNITQRGRRSSKRNPHHYQLPYLHSYDENGNKIAPTDEWKKYRAKPKKLRQKQNSGSENATRTGSGNATGISSENATVQPEISRSENDTAFYNLSIYVAEAEGAGEVASHAKPAWSTPIVELLPGVKPEDILREFGYGDNGGPPLDDLGDLRGMPRDLAIAIDDLSIPDFLRRAPAAA